MNLPGTLLSSAMLGAAYPYDFQRLPDGYAMAKDEHGFMLFVDADTGFKAVILRNIHNPSEIMVAFAGTEESKDWYQDLQLGWGQWTTAQAAQLRDALSLLVANGVDSVLFTGHSLGGALAQYATYDFVESTQSVASNAVDVALVTFNGLGGKDALLQNLPAAGRIYNTGLLDNISAYHIRTDGDLVSRLGGGHLGGSYYQFDNLYSDEGLKFNAYNGHLLSTIERLYTDFGWGALQEKSPQYLPIQHLLNLSGNLAVLLNGAEVDDQEAALRLFAGIFGGMALAINVPDVDSLDFTVGGDFEKLLEGVLSDFIRSVLPGSSADALVLAIETVPWEFLIARTGVDKGAAALAVTALLNAVLTDALEVLTDTEQSVLTYFEYLPAALQSQLESLGVKQSLQDMQAFVARYGVSEIELVAAALGKLPTLPLSVDPAQEQIQSVSAAPIILAEYATATLSLQLAVPAGANGQAVTLVVAQPALVSLAGLGVHALAKAGHYVAFVPAGKTKFDLTVLSAGDADDLSNQVQILLGLAPYSELGEWFKQASVGSVAVMIADQAFVDAGDFVGDAANNILFGSGLNDVIYADAGDDIIKSNDSDLIYGGAGDDRIHNDHAVPTNAQGQVLEISFGSAIIHGQQGNDMITGGWGDDTIYGGPGNDYIGEYYDYAADPVMPGGNDALYGGAGDDYIGGGSGRDYIDGGDGNDALMGFYTLRPWDGRVGYTFDANWSFAVNMGAVAVKANAVMQEILVPTSFAFHAADVSQLPESFLDAGESDTIRGGDGHDLIAGNGGDDFLYGDAGNDAISGFVGDDYIEGGAGHDYLIGDNGPGRGYGSDVILGGDGHDAILGQDGDDALYGGAGHDVIYGEGFRDPGGAEYGAAGNDFIDGGAGDDDLLGNAGDDYIIGGIGDDHIWGEQGHDHLYGAAGKDTLLGGEDNDWLSGGPGDDDLVGGVGDDRLFGGAGSDDLLGGEGDDELVAGVGVDRLWGGEGDDELLGGAGADHLEGGEGNDFLAGGDSGDTLLGEAGNDVLHGNSGSDQLDGGLGNDVLYGEAGEDTLWGRANDDLLSGGGGQDALHGGHGDDVLYGGTDADLLTGDAGVDELFGGAGKDILRGGDGSDWIAGGTGDDALYGGAGADYFSFAQGDGLDKLYDADATDVLVFTASVPAERIQFALATSSAENREVDLIIWYGEGDGILLDNSDIDYTQPLQLPTLQFAAGSTLVYNPIIIPEGATNLTTGDANDWLRTAHLSYQIDLGGGHDFVWTGSGVDAIQGGAGNDTIVTERAGAGSAQQNIIKGGGGDDRIATTGNTLYEYTAGDGNDRILDRNASESVLALGPPFNLDSVRIKGQNNNLELQLDDGSVIVMEQWFTSAGDVAQLGTVLVGGEALHPAQLLGDGLVNHGTAGDDYLVSEFNEGATLMGGAGNDQLQGSERYDTNIITLGNDVFIGGEGNDWLEGKSGDDVYRYARGDGADQILDTSGYDSIHFGVGVEARSLTFSRSGLDLHVQLGAPDDNITILGWFDGNRIERFVFEDGPQLSQFDVEALGLSVAGSAASERLAGTFIDDQLAAGGGDDTLVLGAGHDAGFGDNGDDQLYGGWGNDRLEGGEGNDQLYGGAGNDTLVGGAGNDVLDGGVGADYLDPGAGIDTVAFGTHDQIYFARGYGINKLVVQASGSEFSTIQFASQIRASDIVLERQELSVHADLGDLIVRLAGSEDRLVLQGWFAHSANRMTQFVFQDGSQLPSVGAILAQFDQLIFDDTANVHYALGSADTLMGHGGNDRLQGEGGDDTLYGDAGDDVLNGGDDHDVLLGGLGADRLSGGAGADYLAGGVGDDPLLRGGPGSDVYYFELGFGQDFIDDFARVEAGSSLAAAHDQIQFSPEIEAADLLLTQQDNHLVIQHSAGLDQITLQNWFLGESYKVEQLYFAADQTQRHWQYVQDVATAAPPLQGVAVVGSAANDVLMGSEADETLVGEAGDDVFTSQGGHDLFIGGSGNDTYRFERAGRDLQINDFSGFGTSLAFTDPYVDQVQFGIGISASDVTLIRENNDLYLVLDSGERLTIQHWFADPAYRVEQFMFQDGSQLPNPDQIALWVSDVSGTDEGEQLFGFETNDTLRGWAGDDTLAGGDGNDALQGGLGADTLYGDRGDDRLLGGAGSDVLYGYLGADRLEGGLGADLLTGGRGNDILRGGPGDDDLRGGGGDDTYLFGPGHGADTIRDAGNHWNVDERNIIEFSHGLTASDYRFRRNQDDLLMTHIASHDQVTLSDWFVSTAQRRFEFRFADGSTLDSSSDFYAEVSQQLGDEGDNTLQGTALADILYGGDGRDVLFGDAAGSGTYGLEHASADHLYGGNGADTLWGEGGDDMLSGDAGDDTLYGGAGSDTYRFTGQFGEDVIYDYDQYDAAGLVGITQDRILFADATRAEDLQFSLVQKDLVVEVAGTANSITVKNWLVNSEHQIDAIVFSNDEQLTDLAERLQGLPNVRGTALADRLVGTELDDRILAEGGDDQLQGGAGNDWLGGGLGDDTLQGGAGNDALQGGAGNDLLVGGRGSDTYYIGQADGLDTIVEYDRIEALLQTDGHINDTLYFSEGRLPEELEFQYHGQDLIIGTLASADQITIQQWLQSQAYQIETLAFDRGYAFAMNGFRILGEAEAWVGTQHSDVLVANAGDNQLHGGFGDDLLYALDGDDRLQGGVGDDYLIGGAGDDYLSGGQGSNVLIGGAGNDHYLVQARETHTLIREERTGMTVDRLALGDQIDASSLSFARAGNDLTIGVATFAQHITVADWFAGAERQLDELVFASGDTYLLSRLQLGGADNDALQGDASADILVGGLGDDRLSGQQGTDLILGDSGNDRLYGADDDDVLVAGSGTDYLDGGSGDDLLVGGTVADNDSGYFEDYLFGSGGADTLIAGNKWSYLFGEGGNDVLIGGQAGNYFVAGQGDDVLTATGGSYNHMLGGAGQDKLYGSNGADVLQGGNGNDQLEGNAGDDRLDGGAGDDRLTGGAGNDQLNAGAGFDRLHGGSGNDRLNGGDFANRYAGAQADYLYGDAGDDNLQAGQKPAFVYGGTGNDVVTGGQRLSVLYGEQGNDTLVAGTGRLNYLSGGAGDDRLTGSLGNDTLDAGTGNDVLDGRAGDDRLLGKQGSDLYHFGRGSGVDTIVEAAESTTDLDTLQFNPGVAPHQLWFRKLGDTLAIDIIGTQDQVKLQDWYVDTSQRVERIQTAWGDVLLQQQVQQLVDAMAAFDPPAAGELYLGGARAEVLEPVIAASWH